MKDNKSPGVDEVSPKILKETVEQLSTPLAHVFKAKIYEISSNRAYTPITLYSTVPLYHIIIIFDTVLRQKRNIEHEK